MEVTVKTLDSQTKTLQVEPETTVKDFKKKVAEEMGIPTEKQRLIFQGKVLQDEKTLQEYKVNGCVIHLVEKQPPRNNRPNGQSTETTTSTTPSTSTPGNMFMGAFAFPVDVMGVTQQIVQGIIQQIGAESAQANISTASSDDGSSVNVHINLSTVMARNNPRSRIDPAKVHLSHVSSIINRLQNDGMLPNNDMNEETNQGNQPRNGPENDTDCTPADLADVLQQVVNINDEVRPHLQRYQELLRSSNRQLRPGDDLLPDLTAEALHSLSHAYHALSDLTTNFGIPDSRLNVLPSMSPAPAPVARAHLGTRVSQRQASAPQPAATATPQTGTTSLGGAPATIPGATPVITGTPASAGSGLVSGSGLLRGRVLNGSSVLNGHQTPNSSAVPLSTNGTRTTNQHPFLGFPLNVRNLPNLAVQFNPAAGNITIAHIMTTTVDENSPRATTTTTNSTPAPRTSSRGSTPLLMSQVTQGSTDETPPDPDRMDDSSEPTPPSTTASTTAPTTATHSSPGGQNNVVLNFPSPPTGHRDPLLPCQSFHFASLTQRPQTRNGTSRGETTQIQQQRQPGSTQPGPRSNPVPNANDMPGPDLIHHLINMGQHATSGADNSGQPPPDLNPFLEFFRPQPGNTPPTTNAPSGYPGDLYMHNFARAFAGVHRASAGQTAGVGTDHAESDDDSQEEMGTLSRFLCRLAESNPIEQLIQVALGDCTSDPCVMMRATTQEFLRDDILHGSEPTSENLQRATETILDELQSSFESTFASCNVKDGIDITATLLTYLRPKIRRILELINSSASDEIYGAEMNLILTRMAIEFIALTEYCLKDGPTALETIFRTSMASSRAMSQFEQIQRDAITDLSWTYVQDIRHATPIRESFLLPFVVRKEKRKHNGKTESPKATRKEVNKNEDTSTRPVTSVSRDTAASTSSTTRTTNATGQAEDVPMATDEDWKKVIPPEWVPVISQDIIRQRRMPRQPPFSDAYINGMPPKRRRIMTPVEPQPYSQCVSATLKRSIAKSGATPKTDMERVNREASSSPTLGRVFEQEVKNEVRERLSKDTDYQSEKFPSIHQYFEKDSNC